MNATEHHDTLLENIRRVLRHFGGFRRRWSFLDGLARFIMISPGALLIWFAADLALDKLGWPMPAWPLFLSFVVVCGLSLWAGVRWVLLNLARRAQVEREALVVEDLHGELDNCLIGSLQLGPQIHTEQGRRLGYAPLLIEALVVRTAGRLEGIRIKSLVDLSRTYKRLAGAVLVAAILAGCLYGAPDAIRQRGARLQNAWATILDFFFPVSFEVAPGNANVVRGRPIELQVRVKGARRGQVRLLLSDPETGERMTEPTTLSLTGEQAAKTFPAQESFAYRFDYFGKVSDEHTITVEDLPEIKGMNYEITPPAYTGQPMRMITGRLSKVKGLAGTTVLVSFGANTALDPEGCTVLWDDTGQKQAIDVSGRFGSFPFTIKNESTRASIHLTGHLGQGFEIAEPISFLVETQRDRAPEIRLLVREKNAILGSVGGLSAPWIAKDDFGVQEVSLAFQITTIEQLAGQGRPKRQGSLTRTIKPARDRVKGRFTEIFKGVQPAPDRGDEITITLTAKDNNTETGPGRGRSETFKILVAGGGPGGGFTGTQYGFIEDSDLAAGLRMMATERVGRNTNLLQRAEKRVRTQPPMKIQGSEVARAVPASVVQVSDETALYRLLLARAGDAMREMVDDKTTRPQPAQGSGPPKTPPAPGP